MREANVSVEDQLRIYGDAIDPGMNSPVQSAPQRMGVSFRSTWLVAAAVVLVVAGVSVISQRDQVQQVQTGAVSQQPEDQRVGPPTSSLNPPLPDGVPPTGDWRSPEQGLVLFMAESALLSECMAAQGFDYTMPTTQELVERFGSWQPSGVLGITRAGAARSIGYHDAGFGGGGSPTQSAASDARSQEENNAYYAALSDGPAYVPAEGAAVAQPTTTSTTRQAGGCWGYTEATLGDYHNIGAEFSRLLDFGSDETQGERFRSDPVLAGAIDDWQECIVDAVGIDADTPNTLARQFAFTSGPATGREREIAVADVNCQQATNLEEQFQIARTNQLRFELGDKVTSFDGYARLRIETVTLAQQVLDERGIVPPILD